MTSQNSSLKMFSEVSGGVKSESTFKFRGITETHLFFIYNLCRNADKNGCFISGGLPGKMLGRVGDTPLVGCGGYANTTGAASTTGHGESIMKSVLAWNVVRNMEDGLKPMHACAKSVNKMVSDGQGVAGVIAVSSDGEFGRAFSSEHLTWASVRGGVIKFGLERDEVQEVRF